MSKEGPLLTNQAILNAISALSAGDGVIRVSAITAGGTLSLSDDAGSNRVSAFQTNAANLNISSKSGDAGTFRVSAIGGTAGDNILVDGADQTLSATIQRVSGSVSSGANGLIVNAQNRGDAGQFKVSSYQDNASNINISAKSGDGGTFRVSAIVDNGSVSAKSGDAGLFRTSAILDNGSVSAKSNDADQFRVSALSKDGGTFRVSAIVDSGSVSAKSSDAGTFKVSSTLNATTDTGLSYFSTSAGIAQLSAIKQTGNANIYGYNLGNRAGADQWLLLFNASATSAVTLGTTVPDLYLYTPATGGANIHFPLPVTFGNGIVAAVVSAPGGTTAGASAMTIGLFYK